MSGPLINHARTGRRVLQNGRADREQTLGKLRVLSTRGDKNALPGRLEYPRNVTIGRNRMTGGSWPLLQETVVRHYSVSRREHASRGAALPEGSLWRGMRTLRS